MRIAVLASWKSWYLADLRRAAEARHEVVQASFPNLQATVGLSRDAIASGTELPLSDFDAVLVRTMPPGSLEQVVFRMDALARLEAQGVLVINPARSIEAAVDKYLATAKLHEAGLLVPRTIACQTADEAMAAYAELGRDVVVKPLFGSEGRGIARLNDEALALRAFTMLAQFGAVLYLQEFIQHEGHDLRVLKVGRRYFGMRRSNPADWRTNVSRGAVATAADLRFEWIDLAERAADAIGAPVAGVDLLPAKNGRLYAIEVNAVPGWQALSRTLHVDVAKVVLDYVAAVADNEQDS